MSRRSPAVRQLSESIFVVEDTCNAYLIRDGDHGLLIDAASATVEHLLDVAGVSTLEWVLHTHHHRDQCWGTPNLVADYGARVAVPEHEHYLFTSAQEHWQGKRIFDNYSSSNTFFGPVANIDVDALLEDYEIFEWHGIEFFVLPAQGHTFGSVSLLATIDGKRVAFTGDLMTAGGHVYQLHALEYGYGELAGVAFTLQSLAALRREEPELVFPSHGSTVSDVNQEVDLLSQRLLELIRIGGLEVSGPFGPEVPAARFLSDSRLIRLSEHLLWSGPWTCSNFYVLLSGTAALLVDYGHSLYSQLHIGADQQSYERMRFVVHHLDELEERFGVRDIEVVAVTHIHDDHTAGIPYLQRHHGTECWALDVVAQVLEEPAAWASTPCTLSRAIRIDRGLADGERVDWRGHELRFHYAPGQTEFHSVISCEIDGRIVAFTGDNYFMHDFEVAGRVKTYPYQSTVFRNSFQLAMHRRCAEVMRAIGPDLICPGHGDVLDCDARSIGRYESYVTRKELAFREVVAEPADHYLDLFWARLLPYLTTARAGDRLEYTLMLRNNLERTTTYAARLIPPAGWDAADGFTELELGPEERGAMTLSLSIPDSLGRAGARTPITAEILIDGVSQGPLVEALITAG